MRLAETRGLVNVHFEIVCVAMMQTPSTLLPGKITPSRLPHMSRVFENIEERPAFPVELRQYKPRTPYFFLTTYNLRMKSSELNVTIICKNPKGRDMFSVFLPRAEKWKLK